MEGVEPGESVDVGRPHELVAIRTDNVMALQTDGHVVEEGGGTDEIVGEGGDEEGQAGFFEE
eukprot:evm.model.NODE_52245_length_13930_cov_23.048960.3